MCLRWDKEEPTQLALGLPPRTVHIVFRTGRGRGDEVHPGIYNKRKTRKKLPLEKLSSRGESTPSVVGDGRALAFRRPAAGPGQHVVQFTPRLSSATRTN